MELQTLDDIKKLLVNKKIKSIEFNLFSMDNKISYKEDDDGVVFYFTKVFIKNNKELVNEILKYLISEYKDKSLSIKCGSVINDEIVSAVARNSNIEEVTFGNFLDSYILSENHYNILKDSIKKIYSDGVDNNLKYNFDEVIGYNRKKFLIGMSNYDALQAGKIFLFEPLDIEHLEYLKYIGDDVELHLSERVNVIDIIDILRSNGKNNKITYDLKNKKEFNDELFKRNINSDNVYVNILLKTYTLSEYIEYEKILYSFIEPAKDFSPLEKYIYAYDIVKKFKKYKEHKKDKMKSREIYSILNNNYMVCVGYSDLLGDLLDKLGIDNSQYSVEVVMQPYKAESQLKKKYGVSWLGMDKNERYRLICEQKNYIPTSFGGHSRRLVHLVDEKYGINGVYFSDPTWDNDLENDSYNYLLMTSEEVLKSNKKFRFSKTANELFLCSSVKEFNDKLNAILNKTNDFSLILRNLLNIIEKIDNNFYNSLYQRYKFIQKKEYKVDNIYNIPQPIIDCLYDIASYITNNINNLVDGKTILEAVKNVYDDIYVGGMTQEQLDSIQSYNSEKAEINFEVNKFK